MSVVIFTEKYLNLNGKSWDMHGKAFKDLDQQQQKTVLDVFHEIAKKQAEGMKPMPKAFDVVFTINDKIEAAQVETQNNIRGNPPLDDNGAYEAFCRSIPG